MAWYICGCTKIFFWILEHVITEIVNKIIKIKPRIVGQYALMRCTSEVLLLKKARYLNVSSLFFVFLTFFMQCFNLILSVLFNYLYLNRLLWSVKFLFLQYRFWYPFEHSESFESCCNFRRAEHDNTEVCSTIKPVQQYHVEDTKFCYDAVEVKVVVSELKGGGSPLFQ